MNRNTSVYIDIHQLYYRRSKLRKKHICILPIYTMDYFPNYHHIHQQPSPSMTVH